MPTKTLSLADIFTNNEETNQQIIQLYLGGYSQAIQKHPLLNELLSKVSREFVSEHETNGAVKVELFQDLSKVQIVREGSPYDHGGIASFDSSITMADYARPLKLQKSMVEKLKGAQAGTLDKDIVFQEVSMKLKGHALDGYNAIFTKIEDDLQAKTQTPNGVQALNAIASGNTCQNVDGSQDKTSFWMPQAFHFTETAQQLLQLSVERGIENTLMGNVFDSIFDQMDILGHTDLIFLGTNLWRVAKQNTKIDGNRGWDVDNNIIRSEGRSYIHAPKFEKNVVIGFDSMDLKWLFNDDNMPVKEIIVDPTLHKVAYWNSYGSYQLACTRRQTAWKATFATIDAKRAMTNTELLGG